MQITSFPKLSEEFVVQFDFFANKLGTNKQNVIHMTDNNGVGTPAVWLIGGDLDVCMSFNDTSKLCKKIGIEFQKWHTLKMSQRKNGTGYFTFDITLNIGLIKYLHDHQCDTSRGYYTLILNVLTAVIHSDLLW